MAKNGAVKQTRELCPWASIMLTGFAQHRSIDVGNDTALNPIEKSFSTSIQNRMAPASAQKVGSLGIGRRKGVNLSDYSMVIREIDCDGWESQKRMHLFHWVIPTQTLN